MISKNGSINLKKICITLITIYLLTQFLFIAVLNSLSLQLIILGMILGLLLLNEISTMHQKFLFRKTDIFFVLAIIAILGSLHNNSLVVGEVAGPIILSLGLIISLFIRGNIDNYNTSFSLIKWGGFFYALSVIFSYFAPHIYSATFLRLLNPSVAENILESMNNGFYTGFTSQVAYTAGYLISALGIIICYWIVMKNYSLRGAMLVTILLIALMLTQKRAHILAMVVSLILVYILYSKNSFVKFKKTLMVIVISLISFVFVYIIIAFTDFGDVVFSRVTETLEDFLAGEDITSNRTVLWGHAWQLFLENPVYGIGWGNFSDTVIGTVTVHTEMTTHNIYLQLLSETGLIGTVLILTPLLISYLYTIKVIKKIKSVNSLSNKWILALLYSLYQQTFFFLYGITGNPLYDYSYLFMYVLALGLIYSYWKSGIGSENKNVKGVPN